MQQMCCLLLLFGCLCFEIATFQKAGVFQYQNDVKWSNDLGPFWNWLQDIDSIQLACKKINQTDVDLEDNVPTYSKPLDVVSNCSDVKGRISFDSKFDKNHLPHGKGSANRIKNKNFDKKGPKINPCYQLLPTIDRLMGYFHHGELDGKAEIRYNDGSIMKGCFQRGTIQGKVLLFNNQKVLQGVGIYKNGLAHGPFWFCYENYHFLIHFQNGRHLQENVVVLDSDKNNARNGRLVNDTHLIIDSKPIDFKVAKYKSLHIIKGENEHQKQKGLMKMPIRIVSMPQEQRIMVKPSNVLYFNRVAKTGSYSFMTLLSVLGKNHGFEVDYGLREWDIVRDDTKGLGEEIDKLLRIHKNHVICRHYAFFNLKDMGYDWRPDWFSIVRHPIERVISLFYYQRASWNIVQRAKKYPNSPLPDMDFLMLDFETCVLHNFRECDFTQNIHTDNHKSQMAQFCGHEEVCFQFNNPRAFEMAKFNVENSYPVVGVLEKMNITLKVLEMKMPEYFSDATDLYYNDVTVQSTRNRNAYKPVISSHVKALLEDRFSNEIKFYNFCKERLLSQYDEVIKQRK